MAKIFNGIVRTAVAAGVMMPGAALAEGGLPQMDPSSYPSQVFWLTVTFAALFLLMWKVALPRVSETLANRQQKLSGDLKKAAELKEEAEKAQADLEEALASARAEAQTVLRKASEEIAAEQAKRLEAFDADMAAKAEEAEKRIAAARQTALKSVQDVANEVAISAVEKLTGDAADAAAVEKALAAASKNG